MNALEKLAAEIKKVADTANKNLEDLPVAVRGGWQGAITEAKAKLKDLEEQYKVLLLKSGVAIFLKGDPSKAAEFAKLIRDENEGLAVDASALYNRLTDPVVMTLPEGRGVEWGVAQTHRLHLAIQEVMHDLGLSEMPMPARDVPAFIKGRDDVLAHVRRLVRGATSNDLNKLYLEKQLADQARLIRYTGIMVPVAILNAGDDEVYDLGRAFGKGSSTINFTQEDVINREFLNKSFKDINQAIKKPGKKPAMSADKTKEQE